MQSEALPTAQLRIFAALSHVCPQKQIRQTPSASVSEFQKQGRGSTLVRMRDLILTKRGVFARPYNAGQNHTIRDALSIAFIYPLKLTSPPPPRPLCGMAALRFFLLCILLTLSGAQGELQCRDVFSQYFIRYLNRVLDGSDAPVFHPLSSSDGVTFKVYEGAARGP